jgi:hypothetical protein
MATDITNLQAGNTNNEAVFQPNGAIPVLALGVMGTQNLTGVTEINTSDFTFMLNQADPNLYLGLLDPSSTGKGFDSLSFTVTDGSEVKKLRRGLGHLRKKAPPDSGYRVRVQLGQSDTPLELEIASCGLRPPEGERRQISATVIDRRYN